MQASECSLCPPRHSLYLAVIAEEPSGGMLLTALALPCKEMPSAGRRKGEAFVPAASG